MPKNKLAKNKVVLITGAARRIGAEIARFLHANNMNVIIHYHHSKSAAEKLCIALNKQRPRSAITLQADLTKISSLNKLIEKSVKQWGCLNALINNAARFTVTKIGKITESAWYDLLDTNVKAPLFLAQAAAPYLAKQHGCIINIADIHGTRAMRHYPIYSISKAGLLMLTQALARELGPTIRVNAVSPGPTLWPENKNTLSHALQAEMLNRTVLKDLGNARDIAKAVYFLIADADHITGQNIMIDAGRTLKI